MKNFSVYLFILCLGCASTLKENLSFEKAPLLGMIYDYDNRPVNDASILPDNDALKETKSDINGRFIIQECPRGKHSVIVRKENCEDVNLSFQFTSRTQILYIKMYSIDQILKLTEKALESKNYPEASKQLDRVQKLNPNHASYMYLRAICFYQMKQFHDAAAYLEQLLSAGNTESYVHLFLADLYENYLKDVVKAVFHLEQYLMRRNDPEAEKRLQKLKEST